MKHMIFIKYGELTTKKDNRRMFIDILTKNIKNKLSGYEYELIANNDRLYIESDDALKLIPILQNIFGIHSVVLALKVDSNIDSIMDNSLKYLNDENFNTFKVTTKRSDKKFAIPSMEVSRIVGAHILKNIPNISVDVNEPNILLSIEIREKHTYIYTKEYPGLGGYPVGVQGKGLLMLSGGIDSPVAGYLALKRGISLECLYFESPPHTSLDAKNKVLDLARVLTKYGNDINVHIVPFTKIQENIYKNVNQDYMITIMRRMMYRIADQYSKKIKAKCIVNGESVGQVASQTLNSMLVINAVTNMPILRPVCCLDKLEIISLAEKIGTFKISILPFEDCCTIFVPKHPVINPRMDKCLEYENNLVYEDLIKETIDNIEVVTVSSHQNKFENLL